MDNQLLVATLKHIQNSPIRKVWLPTLHTFATGKCLLNSSSVNQVWVHSRHETILQLIKTHCPMKFCFQDSSSDQKESVAASSTHLHQTLQHVSKIKIITLENIKLPREGLSLFTFDPLSSRFHWWTEESLGMFLLRDPSFSICWSGASRRWISKKF